MTQARTLEILSHENFGIRSNLENGLKPQLHHLKSLKEMPINSVTKPDTNADFEVEIDYKKNSREDLITFF
jgi:hypothetical protein